MRKISKKKLKIIKLSYFLLGVFIISVIYNIILAPNNIVLGGVSGLAIVIRELTGLSTVVFIDISNVLLVVVSYIFLGKKETMTQLLGCIAYPLMITLTSPLANIIKIYFPSKLLIYVIAAVIYGFGSGIVYRGGYSTGGFDIITQILSNRLKKPITSISPILNYTVIIVGGIVFNPIQIMYALTIIFISNKVTNAVLFSVSTSKMVYVISEKNKEIESYMMNDIHTGATELKIHSGFLQKKKQMLMCIIHNTQYQKFKNKILKMDPTAFILSKTCYQVSGGIRYELLPF